MYPTDWRSGCMGLSLEQQGLYIAICMFQAETGRRVPLDDSQAARMLGGINVNQYRKVLGQLVIKGKVKRHEDGYGNDRIELETKAAQSAARKRPTETEDSPDGEADQDEGRQGDEIPLTGTPPATPIVTGVVTPPVQVDFSEQNQSRLIEPVASNKERKKEEPNGSLSNSENSTLPTESADEALPSIERTPAQPIMQAFEAYLSAALPLGLAQPRTLTPALRKSIGARLREHEFDGWTDMLAAVAVSDFLTGKNERGWRADLHWIVKPENFSKILSGKYDNRDVSVEYRNVQPSRFQQHPIHAALDALRDRFEPIN
jgi:uncharacterized protein YdaU (DUF1376 family)